MAYSFVCLKLKKQKAATDGRNRHAIKTSDNVVIYLCYCFVWCTDTWENWYTEVKDVSLQGKGLLIPMTLTRKAH